MCVEHDGVVEEGGLAARLQDAPLQRVYSGQVGKEIRVRLRRQVRVLQDRDLDQFINDL